MWLHGTHTHTHTRPYVAPCFMPRDSCGATSQSSKRRSFRLKLLAFTALVVAVFFKEFIFSIIGDGDYLNGGLHVFAADVVGDELRLKSQLRYDYFGQHCGAPSTIVTAYFKLGNRSKYDDETYANWHANFFTLNDAMVIFTDTHSIRQLLKYRRRVSGCTVFVIQSLSHSTRTARLGAWAEQSKLDPEVDIHSPELYIIWNEKSEWLALAAKLNVFNSSHLFWADSGQFRSQDMVTRATTCEKLWIGDVSSFIPRGKIVLLSIEHFEPHEMVLNSQGKSIMFDSLVVRIGGGNFGGDVDAITMWQKAYYNKLREYLDAGVFAGKDQPIMASVCLEIVHMCYIVDGQEIRESEDIWFALQPVLGGKVREIAIATYDLTSPTSELKTPNDDGVL